MSGHCTEFEPITAELLEDISAGELNERLVTLPVFRCQKCAGILTPPVMLVKDVGNVCGMCTSEFDYTSSMHNSALEVLLSNLIIPCSYSNEGCKEMLNYCNVLPHQSICSYRKFCCPLRFLNKACCWEGIPMGLQHHFFEEHKDLIHWDVGNGFKVDIDINASSESIHLLCDSRDSSNFILRTRTNPTELKVQFLLYYIKENKKAPDFIYSVEIENCGITHKVDNVVLKEVDVPEAFDSFRSLSINLSFVKQVSYQTEQATALVKINPEKEENKNPWMQLNDKLLQVYKCPMCMKLMKPPIYMCAKGHSVCNKCKSNLNQCPICKANYCNARNYTLEQFSSDLLFPCTYRDQGCNTFMPCPDIVRHESECSFQLNPCPFSENCQWKGVYADMINHLQIHSDAPIINKNCYVRSFDLSKTENVFYYMVAFNRIFFIIHSFDPNKQYMFWLVQVIGATGEAKRYKYEIGLIDKMDVDKKFVQTRKCLDWAVNKSELLDRGVMIYLTTLNQFSNTQRFITYCRVTKIVDSEERKMFVRLANK